jgi:hypothetical protein
MGSKRIRSNRARALWSYRSSPLTCRDSTSEELPRIREERSAAGPAADKVDSEKLNAFVPLGIHSVSLSPGPMTHVFAVLDTVGQAEEKGVKMGLYGKDVMVWGGNGEYGWFRSVILWLFDR